MPVVTKDKVLGFAHCTDPRCRGSVQQPDVELEQTVTSFLYTDLGGDLPHEERSTHQVTFAHPEDAECPHCGGPRECTTQKRPEYQRVIGGQDKILELRTGAEDRQQSEIDELKAQVAALTEAALTEALAGKANKPGPKPKED